MSGNNNQNSFDFGDDATIDGDVIGGDSNVITFNHTEILQISVEKITSRELITTSPYKGLKPFDSRDKELFFGRDNFITTLVNELEQTNLILLLGASGSGKSSMVRAGLIPWLEKKHGTGFTNLIFTPDAEPFESFYASLLSAGFKQAEVEIAWEGKAETLIKVVNNLKKLNEFWFIFVDQFEELFTISDKNKGREFINGLIKLSKAKLPKVKIIGTMRADFFEKLSDFPQLVKATQKHRPMIVEMQPKELRDAIEQPAAYHGMVFEAGLVDKIIAGVQGQAGYLSLLQYTLNLLWQEEKKTGNIKNRILSSKTYQKLGGVRGALQQHVDNIYQNFSPSEQQGTQRIFLKLVGIGENAEAGIEWKPVRRRAQLSEFGDDERDVLLKLVNYSLLVSNADISATGSKRKSDSTIEITHEILLTCWDKLNKWIKENRQVIALRNRLYEDVKRWQDNHKPEDELWTGSKLEQALELRKDENFERVLGGFNPDANKFIDASVGVRDRQLRRARRNAAIGFTLATLASVASVLFFIQQQETQKQSIISITQTSETHLLLNNQLDAMVEAIRAKKQLDNVWIGKDGVSLRVLGSLGQTVHHNQKGLKERLRLRGRDVIFSPNGKLLATIDENIVRIWNAQTGEELSTLQGHEDSVNRVVFSPDGKRVATASGDTTARVWDADTREVLQTLQGHESGVISVVFSPDGKRVATGSNDKTARVWDADTGEVLQILQGHKSMVISVVFSPDGKRVATASGDTRARMWDADTGDELQIFQGHEFRVNSLVFSPDGKRVATTPSFARARLWDADTGEVLQILPGNVLGVTSLVFSPDGKRVATTPSFLSNDRTARLWDADTGEMLQILPRHEDSVRNVVFSPDGQRVATTASFARARVWDTATRDELQILQGHEDLVYGVVFSPDGQRVATASHDGTARVWRVGNMEDMLAISCDWVRPYLASKPEDDEDKHLCDGVGSFQE